MADIRVTPAPPRSNGVLRALLVVVLALSSGPACATAGRERHELARTRVWKQYKNLPDARAIALAGEPSKVWVVGMAGGQASVAEALAAALAECGRQRTRRRIQSPCKPYAEGDRVVWVDAGSLF